MKVKDVMTKQVKSLSPDANVKEALDMLFELEMGGLPVIDKQNKFVGMVTEKDILKSILPTYLGSVGRFVYEENPKSIKNKVAGLAKLKVSDIMLKDIITVREDTTLCEVAHIMMTQNVRRVPVLDKTGRAVGIAGRRDVLKGLIEEERA